MTINLWLCAFLLLQGGRPTDPRPSTVVVGVVTSVVGREVTLEGAAIVSDVTIAVEETIKGPAKRTLTIVVLGGTVRAGTPQELRMASSNIDVPEVGDRVVFFLDADNKPTETPGRSLLQLDRNDRVRGTSRTLWDIRRAVKR